MPPTRKSYTVLAVLALALFGLTHPAPTSAADQKSAQEVDPAAVERIIQDYLLKNPEVIVRALEAYKEKAEAQQEAAVRQVIEDRRDEIYNDPASAVGGNTEGDITVVEFFDYRCGVCKRTHDVVEQLLKRDGKIRLVYKEWPILGPESVYASRAAIASRKQAPRKYVAFHNALMTAKRVTRDSVLALAAQVGLDTRQLERDMNAPDVGEVIKRNYALARALNLNGTPSFLIGKTLLRGARDLETLLDLVKDEREKG